MEHPEATGKTTDFIVPSPDRVVNTDRTLMLRVLTNMLKNALEATQVGGRVRIRASAANESVSIIVWNQKAIPNEVKLRIFQKHFSTKTGYGRGIGTYSMKFLGEKILKGTVAFTSSPENGTEFSFTCRSV